MMYDAVDVQGCLALRSQSVKFATGTPSLRWDDEYEEWLRVSHRHRIHFLKMGMTSQSQIHIHVPFGNLT